MFLEKHQLIRLFQFDPTFRRIISSLINCQFRFGTRLYQIAIQQSTIQLFIQPNNFANENLLKHPIRLQSIELIRPEANRVLNFRTVTVIRAAVVRYVKKGTFLLKGHIGEV